MNIQHIWSRIKARPNEVSNADVARALVSLDERVAALESKAAAKKASPKKADNA